MHIRNATLNNLQPFVPTHFEFGLGRLFEISTGLLFLCARVLCSSRVVYYFTAFVYGFENRNVQNTLPSVVPVVVRIDQKHAFIIISFYQREMSGLHFF